MSEHEDRLALRWGSEQPLRDLAVGAAHADLESADENLALARLHAWNVFDARPVRVTRLRDEREHV